MAQLTLRGVHKSFGDAPVIRGVDLELAGGEFTVLVGPSGSGKTTLLRLVAGLERASSGSIVMNGRAIDALPPHERDIAMVFQQYALYPYLDVEHNLGFSLKMRGEPSALIRTRVREVADILGLVDCLQRHPSQLSGGQQQRVAIGRAIVRRPQLFLFDEPLSNLDGALRTQMRGEIKALHRRLGASSLFVTHDQAEAMAMADRIVVMRHGRIEQCGRPLELYDRPANLFVAGFIGTPAINVLPGPVLGEDARVMVAFRPEACTLGGDSGLAATVTGVEPMGPSQNVYLQLGDATLCAVTPERRPWAPGETLHVQPDAARLLRFDRASGRAL